MQTFVDRNSHPHRAAEARQFSLDATHPRVRTIQREIAQRYEQLAAIPNVAPIGAFSLGDSPCDEARTTPASSRGAARWHEDGTVGPASPGGCNWENEGGAPRYAAPAHATVMPNPPMFAALDDVELTRDLPTAGSNSCASPSDEERPSDGKPHIPPVTSSAASLGKAAGHHIDRHTGVAGINLIDPAGVDLERKLSVDRGRPMASSEALEAAIIRAAPQLVWRY